MSRVRVGTAGAPAPDWRCALPNGTLASKTQNPVDSRPPNRYKAVSKEDEGQIGELMRELGVKSKAQVVRAALRTLRERLDQARLRSRIRESVQRCAEADRRENRLLTPGAVPRYE